MSDRIPHYSRSDQFTKTLVLLLIFLITEIIIDIEIKYNRIKFRKKFNELRFLDLYQ